MRKKAAAVGEILSELEGSKFPDLLKQLTRKTEL